jgi:hypothetical protein
MPIDYRQVIAENVRKLMQYHWQEHNTSRLGRQIKSQGGAQRVLSGTVFVRIDLLTKTAAVFDLHPWHLLVPNLDPKNPPTLIVSAAEQKLYKAFEDYNKAVKGDP